MLAVDFDGTLAQIAQIGYHNVEFAGYFDRTPTQVRASLARAGLAAPSTHVPFEVLEGDWQAVLDTAIAAGHRFVVVPWIPDVRRRSLDDYHRLADLFERAGERARVTGLDFAYHNQAYEFEDVGGTIGFDVLLGNTTAANVKFELDLFWIRRGGGDPGHYLASHPGRFPLVHVKDMDAEGEMVDPGQGEIDFPAILARAGSVNIRHYFVEHDEPADALATMRTGYAFLRQLNRS